MRLGLAITGLFVSAAASSAFACSSSSDPSGSSSSGTIAPLGDGGGSKGDDDDGAAKTQDCSGVKSLDCAQQTAHAKEAACPKFDAKQWTDDCEALNCGTPTGCAKELKDLGDCLLEQPPVCTEAGGVDSETPPACKDKDGALTNCLLGK